ncbi:MAG: bile acid:sodium symporter family protein [Rhodothalassiaceae bacterium]
MNVFSAWLLPLVVAYLMLAMGLALRPADFLALLAAPRAALLGVLSQLLLLPLLGFLVASLGGLPPVYAAGLMIIAACPGGPMSNLLTHLAGGDTALSIALTAVMSLVAIVTLPLIVGFSLPHFMGETAPPLPVAGTIFGLMAMTLVPVALGMTFKSSLPDLAARIEPAARRMAALLFVLFLFAAVAMEWQTVTTHLPDIAPPVIALNILVMTSAFALASAARLERERRIAITLECGIQNGSLAMFVAATLLGNDEMMLPGAAYGLFMFPTALLFVALLHRTGRHVVRAGGMR